MKKTLIALAAVAVSSAAMAQVTISGSVSAGFQTSVDKDGVESRGYGFDDNEVRFSVTEDLGGGLKASASMTVDTFTDGHAATGDGTTLGLSGGFGSLTFSTVGGADFLPVDGLTDNGNGTTGDRLAYVSPTFNGFKISIIDKDGTKDEGYGKRANNKANALAAVLDYAAGPLAVTVMSLQTTNKASAADLQSRVGFKVGYNFGVAAISYGQLKSDYGTSADNTETGLTISAPLGPVTVGAAMATSKTVGAAKLNGSSLSVTYALSKRTSLAFYNESHDNLTAGGNKVKETSLKINHKF
jgi:hypothetical protein